MKKFIFKWLLNLTISDINTCLYNILNTVVASPSFIVGTWKGQELEEQNHSDKFDLYRPVEILITNLTWLYFEKYPFSPLYANVT